ncbi:isomerase [Streptomyces sp. TRM76323]|uniref:Isomerase n=1 Tax=Streptomyces tamarix TaxID=3078565 RepID=A0ABU3QMD8_9ACTN|nr:isomerase [Streptomyces tamarix]MDT9683587.1 isomerase [Streptomyces tamarix]
MPQITVDYSAALDDTFDRKGYARALHPVVADTVATRVEACRTRTRRIDDFTAGDGTADAAIVYVEIALLAGRTDEAKARLAEAAAALARDFLKPDDELTVYVSAEIRDLDASYRKA